MKVGHLMQDLDAARAEERFVELARGGAARVERIVTLGQVSPPGFWYDQADSEWVMVVCGGARLEVEGAGEVTLAAGDWIELPAHTRHRVAWTQPDAVTVWLAVFYAP